MKFFKYIALAVLASTISAGAVQSQTVGKLKKNDTVVIAVDDLIDETELTAALATYATKTWAATTATNAANHAASSKVSKVSGTTANHVVKFVSGGEIADSGLAVDDLLTTASLTAYAKKDEMKVEAGTGANADKTTITLKTGTSATVLTSHQDISGKANKATNATANHLASLTADGHLADSGIAKGDVATKAEVGNKVTKTTSIEKLDNDSTISDVYDTINAIIDALNQ